MAAAYRSSTTNALGNRTNTTFNAPAGLANNDILLCVMSCGDGGDQTAPTVTPPTGFAAVTGGSQTISKADPYATKIQAFWKLAASESGSYTFSHGAADSEGILYAISGADATPINPNATAATGTSDTPTATGLTTPNDGSLVVWGAVHWDSAATSVAPPTGTTPTFTGRYAPGSGGIVYVADGVMTTAGATGNKSILTTNNQLWGAILICIEADTGAAAGQPAVKRMGGVAFAHGGYQPGSGMNKW
jgi:hypothetical protein